MSKKYDVAIVGATGAVGEALISILDERNFPINNLYPLASKRSAGSKVKCQSKSWVVEDLDSFDFSKVQIGLFSAGGDISAKYVPIATEKGCVVIDNTSHFRRDEDIPLVVPEVNPQAIADWDPFRALLNDEDKLFVLHSSSEDLSVLLTRLGCLPKNLFDTQLATAFLGEGFSLSYQALLELLLEITVSKEETRSDWLKRPLTDTQLHYAALDVRYLHAVHTLLSDRLAAAGKLEWFNADCAQQTQTAFMQEDEAQWEVLFGAISNSWKLNDQGLSYLQALTIWREREARRRDRPRSWIAKDNELQAMAYCLSTGKVDYSLSGLKEINDVPGKFIDRYGRELLNLMSTASQADSQPDRGLLNPPLNPTQRKQLKSCQQAARAVAEKLQMAPELLAKKKYLLALLIRAESGAELWRGEFDDWRRDLLQSVIDPILAGSPRHEQ